MHKTVTIFLCFQNSFQISRYRMFQNRNIVIKPLYIQLYDYKTSPFRKWKKRIERMDAYISFDGMVALSLMESKTSVGCICLKFGIPERGVRKFNNKNSFKFEKQWQNVETKAKNSKTLWYNSQHLTLSYGFETYGISSCDSSRAEWLWIDGWWWWWSLKAFLAFWQTGKRNRNILQGLHGY